MGSEWKPRFASSISSFVSGFLSQLLDQRLLSSISGVSFYPLEDGEQPSLTEPGCGCLEVLSICYTNIALLLSFLGIHGVPIYRVSETAEYVQWGGQ